ncbi:MAG: DnaB-like helicase C-terminal domain-containing protein [Bacteroidales bacterium]
MIKSLNRILSEPASVSYLIPGYKTGYPSLDSSLGGILDSDLVLIAAKIGNCSSILLLNLAVGLSSRYHVLLISTIKGAPAVAQELKSVLLPENEKGESDEDVLNELNRRACNIFLEDEAHFLEDIEHSIARFRSEYPAEVIVLIDDLNNIFLSKEIRTCPRSKEEGDITSNLRMLTLKYSIPILLLTKIESANPIKKQDPPSLCDLDHLTGLNTPFNNIIGVHLSGSNRIDADEKGLSSGNRLFLHILKNNNGTSDIIPLTFSDSNKFRLKEEVQNQFE